MASWEAQPIPLAVPEHQTSRTLAEFARLPAGFPQIIDSPLAWTGSQFTEESEYILELTEEDVAEAEGALKSFEGM